MAYYKELNQIVDNVICEKILRNQHICKLLYYYPNQSDLNSVILPYLDYAVYEQPDISDTSKLFMKHIYPLPKMPDAKTEQQAYICVTLSGGYETDINIGFRKVNLLIDIICHLNIWYVREGYRPYLIMSEIDEILNNKLTDLPIENKPYSRGFQPRDYSNYYYGLQMLYELSVNSNIDCMSFPQNINLQKDEPDVPLFIPKPNFLPKNLGVRE